MPEIVLLADARHTTHTLDNRVTLLAIYRYKAQEESDDQES